MSHSTQFRTGIKLVAVIGFSLLLAACGGGGSGGSISGSGSGSGSSATGTASKGILMDATVTATSLDKVTTYGQATTSDGTGSPAGTYSLKLTGYDGTSPILLTLTAGSGATMVCDAIGGCGGSTHFGDHIALSDTSPVVLHAVLPATTSGTISAAITPWTDMAYQYIVNTDGTSASSSEVADANGMIGGILGVNPITTQPVDLSSTDAASASPQQVAYSVFNAAFANLLYGQTTVPSSTDLGSAITALTSEFKDGSLGGSSAVVTPSALATDVDDAVNDATIGGNIGSSNTGGQLASSVVATYPTTGTLTPPSTTTAQSDLSAAKTLVGEVRTLGDSVVALKSPADVFGTHLSTAAAIIHSNTNVSFAAVSTVLTQTLAYLQNNAVTLNTPATFTLYDSQQNNVGNATLTLSDNGGSGSKLVISVPTFGATSTVPSSIDLTFTSTVPVSFLTGTSSSTTLSSITFDVSGSVTDGNSGSTLSLTSAELQVTLNSSYTVTTSSSGGIVPSDITGMTLTGAVDIKAYPASSGGTGLLAEFQGNASVSGVALDPTTLQYSNGTSTGPHFALKSVSLDGTFTDSSGNSFTATASANLTNAAQFDALGYLAGIGGHTVYVNLSYTGDQLNAASYAASNLGMSSIVGAGGDVVFGDGDYYSLPLAPGNVSPNETCFASASTQNCVSGDPLGLQNLAQTWFTNNTSGYQLNGGAVGFVYSPTASTYSPAGTQVYMALDLTSQESAISFAEGTLTLTTDLALSGYPDTLASLVIDRTALDTGDATLTLSQNAVVQMTAQLTHTSTGNTLTFTDPSGVTLTIAKTGTSPLTGTLTAADGTQVATVTQVNNTAKVTYSDGSFETLQ